MQYLAIHSVPRSGSTWLGTIFNSHPQVIFKLQPLFSYAFKGKITPNATKEDIINFFNDIAHSDDDFINQMEGVNKGIVPYFGTEENPTHICYKEVRYHHVLENMLQQASDVKVILLVRNPLSVLYSWYQAPKEFKSEQGWVFEDEWLDAPMKNLNKPEEFNGYSKWKEAAYLFLNLKAAYPKQVFLLRYEDLLENPEAITKTLFEFVGLSYHEQTSDFILKSTTTHHVDAYSVYKVKTSDDSWKQLPKHIIDYIVKDLKNTSLERFIDE